MAIYLLLNQNIVITMELENSEEIWSLLIKSYSDILYKCFNYTLFKLDNLKVIIIKDATKHSNPAKRKAGT